ncbi:hypothetical protein CHU92_14955 [Flavobacterium cyanobacteriorum]|uniref:DUF3829 domain-containing protein n=1 Tax=Flavobacterium cyanobacteriorum TaxID=2022802 RepID=A0A255YU41_9FLAO|nr:hypothetical protein [Flavobacterium cyanobacteriorum]OYQ31940.1 hypothetical protein CHU92_14955 [Flavobacterium cyanobacteriorum]
MKKTLFYIFLFAYAASFSAVAQNFKTPIEYLNYIGKETEQISASTWKYTKAVAHSKRARKIEATRKELIKSIQSAIKKIEAAKNGYNGDTEYRDQLLAYLTVTENYINEEYSKIINLQEVAEQSYDFMEAYITARDLINNKINSEVEKLNINQKIFANKYNIQITENNSKLSQNMKISDEVFDHQSEMYLIFFKVYITDENLMKAVAANDINSIQQNASALEQYADEGLMKLKDAKPYKNDMLLVNATKKMLETYKKEAVEYAPQVVDFMMMKQKAEEAGKSINSKSSPSKEEIAAYNKTVADFNKLISNYNNLNTNYNNDKNKAINDWNQASETFVSKHVPKD